MAILWNLSDDGVLTIQGNGRMPDYACNGRAAAPWSSRKDRIRHISIREGITEIGIRAFEFCTNLVSVYLPESVCRIHTRAFFGCENLTRVRAGVKNTQFRYIHEPEAKPQRGRGRVEAEHVIRFGVGSFYNVPWAKKRWHNFYVADGVLYASLSPDTELVIPEGVRVMEKFALKDTAAESVRLPGTLEKIGAFAFADSLIRELDIPNSVTEIEDYAFADSRLEVIDFPEKAADMISKETFRKSHFRYRKCREGVPDLYEVATFPDKKNYGKRFRYLQVRRKAPKPAKADPVDTSVYAVEKRAAAAKRNNLPEAEVETGGCYGAKRVDVARSLLRKMTAGSVILMVRTEEGRVTRVESFEWDGYEKLVNEYLMYPCMDDGELSIYRDSFTWQEKEDFTDAFSDMDPLLLMEENSLRKQGDDWQEQWFWSNDRLDFGGPLELELLKYWLAMHPEVRVDTEEERMGRQRNIMFVPI